MHSMCGICARRPLGDGARSLMVITLNHEIILPAFKMRKRPLSIPKVHSTSLRIDYNNKIASPGLGPYLHHLGPSSGFWVHGELERHLEMAPFLIPVERHKVKHWKHELPVVNKQPSTSPFLLLPIGIYHRKGHVTVDRRCILELAIQYNTLLHKARGRIELHDGTIRERARKTSRGRQDFTTMIHNHFKDRRRCPIAILR